ncbi:hypothetical protein OROHE_026474 [Orobanche hederae]
MEGPTAGHTHVSSTVVLPLASQVLEYYLPPVSENMYSLSEARKIAELAASCLAKSAKDWLAMSKMSETLKQVVEVSGPEGKYWESVEENDGDGNPERKIWGVSESAKRRMARLLDILV